MSLLKAIKAQLGLSNTPANNFTITAEADNGTLKLARGNAGATTQDILTVDVNGNVLVGGNNLNLFSAKSLASNGYQKLPSGLIIQWGLASVPGNNVATAVGLPIAWPTSPLQAVASVAGAGFSNAVTGIEPHGTLTTSYINLYNASPSGSQAVRWVAIGH